MSEANVCSYVWYLVMMMSLYNEVPLAKLFRVRILKHMASKDLNILVFFDPRTTLSEA